MILLLIIMIMVFDLPCIIISFSFCCSWCSSCHYYCYHYLVLEMFFISAKADGLSLKFEWQQLTRTHISILADHNNAVDWMVSTRPLISKSSSPCTNLLLTVPRAPIMICVNVTFMFHRFFKSLAESMYLSFFSLSFNFTQWSAVTTKFPILQVLVFPIYQPLRSGRIWHKVNF